MIFELLDVTMNPLHGFHVTLGFHLIVNVMHLDGIEAASIGVALLFPCLMRGKEVV